MAVRTCSECSKPLRHDDGTPYQSSAKTCGENCRKKRTRRLARNKKRGGARTPAHMETMRDAVNHASKDVLHEVTKEELRPIVRESITADVLIAVDKMVRLTPRMIDLIAQDMEDPDAAIRQKAYTLLARYTLGNQSVAPQPDAPSGQKLEVTFNVPRAGDETLAIEGQATAVRTCVECGVERPEDEFVAGSDRCESCHAALQARVAELFPDSA